MSKENDRKRAENWTKEEERSLIDAITPFHHEITGKLSNKITSARKKMIWSSIATTVGAISGVRRDITQVKRKWASLNSSAKALGATVNRKRQKTGGGKSDDDDESENEAQVVNLNTTTGKLLKLMGPIAIKGISGGLDTCEKVPETARHVSSDVQVIQSQPVLPTPCSTVSLTTFANPSTSTLTSFTDNQLFSSIFEITLPNTINDSTATTANSKPTNTTTANSTTTTTANSTTTTTANSTPIPTRTPTLIPFPRRQIAKPVDIPKEMLKTQNKILEEQVKQSGHLDRIATALETLVSKFC